MNNMVSMCLYAPHVCLFSLEVRTQSQTLQLQLQMVITLCGWCELNQVPYRSSRYLELILLPFSDSFLSVLSLFFSIVKSYLSSISFPSLALGRGMTFGTARNLTKFLSNRKILVKNKDFSFYSIKDQSNGTVNHLNRKIFFWKANRH